MTSILIAMHDFHRGGTERVALMLAAEWQNLGADVTILCGNEEGGLRDQVPPGVMVMVLDPPIPRSATSRLAMGKAVESVTLRPDVIFLPGNFHFFLAPHLKKAMPRAKIALKISNPPLPPGLVGRIAAPFFRRATRAVDGFAAMNAGLARQMRGLMPGRKVGTLYDPVRMADAPAKPRGDVLNVLWIGRLEPQKDVALALDAIAALKGARDCYLTILGDGAERGRVEQALGVLPVSHIGNVTDIAPYLAAADVLLVTSRYEGGPAVAIEALAMGVPVVSTDCSYLLHEVMTTPEAGRIVPSRDPQMLAAALAEIGDAPRPSRSVLRALTARFEPQACARAYLEWFATL